MMGILAQGLLMPPCFLGLLLKKGIFRTCFIDKKQIYAGLMACDISPAIPTTQPYPRFFLFSAASLHLPAHIPQSCRITGMKEDGILGILSGRLIFYLILIHQSLFLIAHSHILRSLWASPHGCAVVWLLRLPLILQTLDITAVCVLKLAPFVSTQGCLFFLFEVLWPLLELLPKTIFYWLQQMPLQKSIACNSSHSPFLPCFSTQSLFRLQMPLHSQLSTRNLIQIP